MSALVEVRDLHQTYPVTWSLVRSLRRMLYRRNRRNEPQVSLQGVNLDIEASTILGLLGPADSGKSTLLRVIAGLVQPSRGQVRIMGLDPFSQASELAGQIGYVVQQKGSFRGDLTPRDNLMFFAGMHGLHGHAGNTRVNELLEGFGLGDVTHLPCRHLSVGTLHRLAVARALLTDPEVLVIDTLTSDLDPIHRSEFYGFLLDHVRMRGCAVVYATHNLNEAQFLCHQVALMDQGRVVAQGDYLAVSAAASTLFDARQEVEASKSPLYPRQTDLRQTRRRRRERW